MSPPYPLRVLLVDPSLFTAPYDAALTEGLVAAGVQPKWAVRPTRPGDREVIAREHVDDFFYRHVDKLTALPAAARAVAKGVAHAAGLAKLLGRVVKTKPDVVHFQWAVVPPLDALAMALIRNFCPVVLTVHDTTPYNGDRPSVLQGLAFDLPIRLADRVIVHTRSARDRLVGRGIGPDKVSIVPHGPLQLAGERRTATAPRADGKWTFVLFGELKHYKGIDLLVEAVGLLPIESRKQARFIVAGRPRMNLEPILERIKALGLEDAIEVWPRRLSEEEMGALFALADCYVFPYREIDASGVYFLVKGRGKWLIATRVGIFAEDLKQGSDGELVSVEDSVALAAALARSIAERTQPLQENQSATWPAIGQATAAVYQRSLAAHFAKRRIPPQSMDGVEMTTLSGTPVKQEPLISIVITCFNYARYVAGAIESALAQTYTNREVIVVNDGSVDESLAIISRYADRIIIIDQPNQGHIAAYNRGFVASRGDIIVFLDADDLLSPEALSAVARVWSPACAKVQYDLAVIDGQGADLGRRFCNFDDSYDSARVRRSFSRTGTYRWPVTVGNAYARWFVEEAFPLELDHVGPDGALNTLAPVYGEVITIAKPLGSYRLHGANNWSTLPLGDLRLPARIRSRQREVADMRTHAARRGVVVPPGDVLEHELAFVNYRMSAFVLGLDYVGRANDSRAKLCRAAGQVLRAERLPLKLALGHAAWFAALAVTPAPMARGLIQLRMNRAALKSSVEPWRRWFGNFTRAASPAQKRAA